MDSKEKRRKYNQCSECGVLYEYLDKDLEPCAPDGMFTDSGAYVCKECLEKKYTKPSIDIDKLTEIAAIMVAAMGMQAENMECERKGHAQAYSENQFNELYDELRALKGDDNAAN